MSEKGLQGKFDQHYVSVCDSLIHPKLMMLSDGLDPNFSLSKLHKSKFTKLSDLYTYYVFLLFSVNYVYKLCTVLTNANFQWTYISQKRFKNSAVLFHSYISDNFENHL